jgi:hypothetical protein
MPKLTRRGTVSKDILRPEYLKKYGYKRHNGDEISVAMAEYCGSGLNFELPKMVKVAADNDLADKLAEWADERDKSNGMLRMLLGAQLRKRRRQGIDIVIGPTVIPGQLVEKAQRVYVPKVKEPRRSIRELLEELKAAEQAAPEPEPEPPPPGRAAPQPQLRKARRTASGHRVAWSREDIPSEQR